MKNILSKIIAHKKLEVDYAKKRMSISALQELTLFHREILNFQQALKDNKYGIIAEFKRKSPSKQAININAKVTEVVPAYAKAGAAAVSVLTDQHFFGGSLNDLQAARSFGLPLLRKDFIVNEYQLFEAKAYGADAILLIANVLEKNKITDLSAKAKELNLQVLLEFYGGEDFDKYNAKIDMVGINNRNLNTFEVDYQHAIRMRNQLPENVLTVAESAIYSPEIYLELKQHGFNAFLMGEYFMKSDNPGLQLSNFIKAITNN